MRGQKERERERERQRERETERDGTQSLQSAKQGLPLFGAEEVHLETFTHSPRG